MSGHATGRPRIGYYVHHVGSGHRHRATRLAAALSGRGIEVTGLSSSPRPRDWIGEWIELPRDDVPMPDLDAEVEAGGLLHWAPLHHAGTARRAARILAWIVEAGPRALVSDVSQEVTVLARTAGVPVISVLLPGERADHAHRLGLRLSAQVVAFWPPRADGMTAGLPADITDRLRRLGGLSRFAPEDVPDPQADHGGDGVRRGLVLAGSGGDAEPLRRAAEQVIAATTGRGWMWETVGIGRWVEDPWPLLRRADLVLTHTGQNAIAEVAASRTPALLVPLPRPHAEQSRTAAVLNGPGWPATTYDPDRPLVEQVDRAAGLRGDAWAGWVDGAAAERFASVVEDCLTPASTLAGVAP